MAPHLLVSEIRTVAADTLWMSPQYERDTVALHFTWRPDTAEVTPLVTRLEAALGPVRTPSALGQDLHCRRRNARARYPRHADFVDLVHRFDPRGAFRTAWLDRNVLT